MILIGASPWVRPGRTRTGDRLISSGGASRRDTASRRVSIYHRPVTSRRAVMNIARKMQTPKCRVDANRSKPLPKRSCSNSLDLIRRRLTPRRGRLSNVPRFDLPPLLFDSDTLSGGNLGGPFLFVHWEAPLSAVSHIPLWASLSNRSYKAKYSHQSLGCQ